MQILSVNVFLWRLADESLRPRLVDEFCTRPIELVPLLATREHLSRVVDEMRFRDRAGVLSRIELTCC